MPAPNSQLASMPPSSANGTMPPPKHPGPSSPPLKQSTFAATLERASGYVTPFKRRPSVDTGLRYSSNDWFTNFLSIPTSYIFRRIRYHWACNVAFAIVVTYYYHHKERKGLAIPMVGHSLLASSLGLLLSYRTSSAYGRFWEARGHWTKTKSACRNLACVISQAIQPQAPKAAARMMELLEVYPSTLMHLCLGGAARLSDDVQRMIPPPAIPDQFQEDFALPAMLLHIELHKTLHEACCESKTAKWHLMDAVHLTEAQNLVTHLMDELSCCEKILRTPVPWTYSRHTSRFLTLYMGTLPFALVKNLSSVLTVLVVAVLGYCLFGIEEISHLIEQPFLGDPDQVWSKVDAKGEAADLMIRGRKTEPYDIGIPVCRLAEQIKKEIRYIACGGKPEQADGLVSLTK